MPPSHRYSDPFADCAQVLAALAQDLNVAPEQIDGIYRRELSRLTTGARIPQFVVTLAVRNTRRILRRAQSCLAVPARISDMDNDDTLACSNSLVEDDNAP